jgi:hypothetical protein
MKQFSPLGIPSDEAFGVDRLPQHRARLLIPPEARPLIVRNTFSAEDASALEKQLRRLLDSQR